MKHETASAVIAQVLKRHTPDEDPGFILQALDHGDPTLSEWGRTRGIAVAAAALFMDGNSVGDLAEFLGNFSEASRGEADPEDDHAEVSGGDFIDWLSSTHPTLWVRLRSAFLHRGNER
jgi:hypothetical protein